MSASCSWRLLIALAMLPLGSIHAQALELALARPRFIATWVTAGASDDASGIALLQRRVSLSVHEVPLAAALREVARQARLDLSYDKSVMPGGKRISMDAKGLTVAAALTEILLQTGLDVAVGRGGQLGLVRKPTPAVADSGSLVGRVTDARTGAPLVGAMIVLDESSKRASTDEDGTYRIQDVPVGTYTVRARYIGYAPGSAVVSVSGDQEAKTDFALEKSLQKLDELVTTGTIIPTEVKALPTPISIITREDLELRHPRTVGEAFRQSVPGGLNPDISGFTYQTSQSVRGASSLTALGSALKVYLDGVEVADRGVAAIDPNSIERIEVIRGPQASTIYGSDAVGGVLQIFTKQGEAGSTEPRVEARAAAGLVQSPYNTPGSGDALRQEYMASVNGGSNAATYHLGGAYTRMGAWVPEGTQSLPSAWGSARLLQGPLTVAVSGRYYGQNTASMVSPDAVQTGFVGFSRPFNTPIKVREQTYGGQATYMPTSWWRNHLTVGVDVFRNDVVQTQPRFTTPSDTFLAVTQVAKNKASIAYNTSIILPAGSQVSASVTAGVDHYVLSNDLVFATQALNTSGTIQTPSGLPPVLQRSVVTNTGYFGQAQVGLRDALFLTAGVRAETNSEFGADVGTYVAPRFGASYARRIGNTSIKVRGAYGRSIRPPAPDLKEALPSISGSSRLANPALGPERQDGFDVGVDLASNQLSFSVTYYNQNARDLIQAVPVGSGQDIQFQNVGRVKNLGIELEGAVTATHVQLKAQYAFTRSRLDDGGPNYTGDLQVGDQSLLVPKHTAGASVTVRPVEGTTLAGGLTYVGSWTYTDFVAQFSCFAGTAPCRPSSRDYLTRYPGFAKLNFSADQHLATGLSAFVAVDNLTNKKNYELHNSTPVIGRITLVGVHVTY